MAPRTVRLALQGVTYPSVQGGAQAEGQRVVGDVAGHRVAEGEGPLLGVLEVDQPGRRDARGGRRGRCPPSPGRGTPTRRACDRNARPTTLATFTLRRGPSGWASIRLRTRLCRLGGSSSASGSTDAVGPRGVGDDVVDELLEVEGVALGATDHRGEDLRLGPASGEHPVPLVDQRRRRLGIERLQHQVGDVVAPDGQAGQGRAVGPRGDDQQHACRRADPGQHLQQVARQRVEPVRVLHDDSHRAGRRPREQQPSQQVLQRGLAQLALERRGQVAVGHRDAEHRPEQRRAGHEPRVELAHGDDHRVGVAVDVEAQQVGPDLAPRGVRRRLGGDRAGLPRRHEHAVRDQLADQLGHQPGLAGAGLGLDDHDLAAAGLGLRAQVAQPCQLRVATDEGVGGARHRGGTVPGRPGAQGRTGTGLARPFTVISVGLVPDEPVARRDGDVLVHQHRPGRGAGHQPGRQVDRLARGSRTSGARRGRRCRCAAGRTRCPPARR